MRGEGQQTGSISKRSQTVGVHLHTHRLPLLQHFREATGVSRLLPQKPLQPTSIHSRAVWWASVSLTHSHPSAPLKPTILLLMWDPHPVTTRFLYRESPVTCCVTPWFWEAWVSAVSVLRRLRQELWEVAQW